jgi:pimeloyl-ACP methyl ester carboxylesterase
MPSVLFCARTLGLVADRVMAVHRETPAEVFLSDLAACDRFDVTGRLTEIQLPSLIITGREDLAVPPKYSNYLHENLPLSTLAVIEDAGHMVMVEQADSVNLTIERFLASLNLASS